MKFVSIREFRNKTREIRRDLDTKLEIVLTANGRPFALLSRLQPDAVEDQILAIRRARAQVAAGRLRAQAKAHGLDRMTMSEIDAVIADVRRKRREAKLDGSP